jgi:hypothetical protein
MVGDAHPSNYLAVGNLGTILSSPNGIDWDLELTPASATNSVLLGVGGSTNLFLIAGSRGTVLWATNIFFWNAISPSPTTNDLQGVCYDGTRYTLCGGNGTILTSTTGTNWISRTSPTNVFLMSVEPYPGGLVAVGDLGTVLTSAEFHELVSPDHRHDQLAFASALPQQPTHRRRREWHDPHQRQRHELDGPQPAARRAGSTRWIT